MASPDTVPAPLSSLTPELTASLKQHSDGVFAYLVKTNAATAFFRESPMLANFRTSSEEDSKESPDFSFDKFAKNVPLSTYEEYRPFVARFLETPRSSSKVSDLFSSGLPSFVANTSGTTGGTEKYFFKYRHPLAVSMSGVNAMKDFNPISKSKGTRCVIYNLRYSELLDVVDGDAGDSSMVKQIPLCQASSIAFRSFMGWSVDNDPALMKTKAPTNTSPLAICFIHSYRASLLLHGLFALEDRSVELINTLFSTICFDFMRLLEEYFDILVQAIEDGKVPEFEGAESVHHHLQPQLKPNPSRAAELRAIGNDTKSPGWIKRLWPNLEKVMGNASGMFDRVVTQIRHYVGPSVSFQSVGLTSTEAWIAYIYDPKNDLNLYKVASDDLFEYLDVTVPETPANLKRNWELESGKAYELIVTTRDGLWRYRLGDVLEIAGFDPVDGQPIIRYSGRRNVVMRASGEITTEKEIQDAIHSLKIILGDINEFTVIIDERLVPRSYGFLVELKGDKGLNASNCPALLHDFLQKNNETYAVYVKRQMLGVPTIRLLAPGTFTVYREWKASTSPIGSGQIKVSTVIYSVEIRDWLLNHVVEEI